MQNFCLPQTLPEASCNAIWADATSPAVFLKCVISNRFFTWGQNATLGLVHGSGSLTRSWGGLVPNPFSAYSSSTTRWNQTRKQITLMPPKWKWRSFDWENPNLHTVPPTKAGVWEGGHILAAFKSTSSISIFLWGVGGGGGVDWNLQPSLS